MQAEVIAQDDVMLEDEEAGLYPVSQYLRIYRRQSACLDCLDLLNYRQHPAVLKVIMSCTRLHAIRCGDYRCVQNLFLSSSCVHILFRLLSLCCWCRVFHFLSDVRGNHTQQDVLWVSFSATFHIEIQIV